MTSAARSINEVENQVSIKFLNEIFGKICLYVLVYLMKQFPETKYKQEKLGKMQDSVNS